jgi:hypothetical protein
MFVSHVPLILELCRTDPRTQGSVPWDVARHERHADAVAGGYPWRSHAAVHAFRSHATGFRRLCSIRVPDEPLQCSSRLERSSAMGLGIVVIDPVEAHWGLDSLKVESALRTNRSQAQGT